MAEVRHPLDRSAAGHIRAQWIIGGSSAQIRPAGCHQNKLGREYQYRHRVCWARSAPDGLHTLLSSGTDAVSSNAHIYKMSVESVARTPVPVIELSRQRPPAHPSLGVATLVLTDRGGQAANLACASQPASASFPHAMGRAVVCEACRHHNSRQVPVRGGAEMINDLIGPRLQVRVAHTAHAVLQGRSAQLRRAIDGHALTIAAGRAQRRGSRHDGLVIPTAVQRRVRAGQGSCPEIVARLNTECQRRRREDPQRLRRSGALSAHGRAARHWVVREDSENT